MKNVDYRRTVLYNNRKLRHINDQLVVKSVRVFFTLLTDWTSTILIPSNLIQYMVADHWGRSEEHL